MSAATAAPHPSLYPRLGLRTADDNTELRYDPHNDRLVCFVTTDSDGVLVAWDMCGTCQLHITICACKNGPALPSYLREAEPGTTYGGVKPGVVDATGPLYVPKPKRAPRDPATGRRVRSDKGKPRGARKPIEAPAAPAPTLAPKNVLSGPCAMHSAESRSNPDGTYVCTVAGCPGVA